jgi:hypothetical protein
VRGRYAGTSPTCDIPRFLQSLRGRGQGDQRAAVLLCDTAIEGEPENVRAILAEMRRDDLETLMVEALDALLDANTRAEKESSVFSGA